MTAYTANLTVTATTAWDTWYSYSDRACNDTATAYRWYVNTFFSEAANRRYQWIGQMIGSLVALAILYTQRWAEAEVQSCIAPVVVAQPQPIEVKPEPETAPAHAMAQTITEPVAVAVVMVDQPRQYSIRELKRMASEAQIKGYSKMPKARLMEVLALA